MVWVAGMEDQRNGIIFSNPEISRPQLDRQLGNEARDVYNNIQPQIQELVLDRLRSGQYDLGLTKSAFNPKSPYYKNLASVITNLGFNSKQESDAWIATYKSKLGIR